MIADPLLPAALLAVILLEGVTLSVLRVATGRGYALSALWPNLLAGAFLLAAWTGAVSDAPVVLVLALLAASGLSHLFDMWRRWPSRATRA